MRKHVNPDWQARNRELALSGGLAATRWLQAAEQHPSPASYQPRPSRKSSSEPSRPA